MLLPLLSLQQHWCRFHVQVTLYDRFTQTPVVCQHDQTSAAVAVHGYMFVVHIQCSWRHVSNGEPSNVPVKCTMLTLILLGVPDDVCVRCRLAHPASTQIYIISVSSNTSFRKTAHTPLAVNTFNEICRIKLNLKRYHKTFISMCENRFYNSSSLQHTSALYCNISS